MEEIYIISKEVFENNSCLFTLSDDSKANYKNLEMRFNLSCKCISNRIGRYGLNDKRVLKPKIIALDVVSTKEVPPKSIIGTSSTLYEKVFISEIGISYAIADIEEYMGMTRYEIYNNLRKNIAVVKSERDLIVHEKNTKFNRTSYCIKNGVECRNYSECLDEMISLKEKNKKFEPKSVDCYCDKAPNFFIRW